MKEFIRVSIASFIVGIVGLIFFEIFIALNFNQIFSSAISTGLESLIAVPILAASFRKTPRYFIAYCKYFLVSILYMGIIGFSFPVIYDNLDFYFGLNSFFSLWFTKAVYYPFYFLVAKYYIFR